MKQLQVTGCRTQSPNVASTPTRLVKSAKSWMLSLGLLAVGMIAANAGSITDKPFYLENKGGPYIISTTPLPSGDGFNGQSLTAALTWTSTTGLTDTVPVGFWNITLYSNNPGTASVVRVDILQGGVSIGSTTSDINASGPGNHTTNFSIPVTAAIAFSNQTLGIKVSQASGAVAKIAANGDFPSTLSWSTTTAGTGGGDSGDGTAGPSGDGGKGPAPTTTTMTFHNTSAFPNSQVYVMIIGHDPNSTSTSMSWFNAATGKFQPMQVTDNNGIGSTPPYTPPASWGLGTKTYVPYSFTIDQHPSITIPWITSSRIFYSYGFPTFMNVVSTPNGAFAAEPGNPTPSDPNYFFPWDYIEINFGSGGLNIDTSRVDAFNIPSNFVITSATGASAQRGDLDTLSHDQYVTAFQNYVASVNGTTVFGPCVLGNPGGRIVNAGASTIKAGGAGATYYDAYINSVWAKYPAGGSAFFNLPIQGGPYAGQVNAAGQMVFTKAGDTTDKFYINRKPTTIEISTCGGAFNDTANSTSTTQSQQLAVQAAAAAAFNRAIALDPSLAVDWNHPGAFYQSSPANYYSAFWHIYGYAGLAYGFPYDDEATQSSDCNYIQPTNVTLNMWYNPIPPVINGTLSGQGTVGTAFSYQITATNNPTSFGATGLPAGLSVNTTTGLISGVPTAAGTFNATIKAINGGGTGSATLALTIKQAPPAITSSLSATGAVGAAFSYQIVASHSPTSYTATGLPPGLSVNTTTGLISGTPTIPGTTNVTIGAANSAGSGTATLAITVAQAPPVISSALTASGTVGAAFSYQIAATNTPTSFSASGLPAGLSVNTASGLISGTPTTAGTGNVTISATNSGGIGSATLALTIKQAAPSITSALSASGTVGTAFSYQITASNNPTSYGAGGLPAGLSLNASTGLISGIPTAVSSSNVSLSAVNSTGTGIATLVITIGSSGTGTNLALNQPATASSFQAGNLVANANDGSTTTRWAASDGTVPQWWEVDLGASKPLSRVDINWYGNTTRYSQYTIQTSIDNSIWNTVVNKSSNTTMGVTSDSFSTSARYVRVNISFVSAGFASAYEIGVYGQSGTAAPAITNTLSASATAGTAFNYQIAASNSPTSYSASGLPAGLSINTTTGLISGTPTTAGTSNVTIGATNAGGTGTATLVITVGAATSTNLALNQPATASSFQAGNLVANANDGSATTRWAAADGTFPQWWMVDLGANKTLAHVDINWFSNATRSYQYKIETSTSNTTYTLYKDNTANTAFGPTSDAGTVTARYVKVTVTGTSGGFASAYEIAVFGH